jgi:transcriptional regulator with XRE-family HTH domain
MAWGTRLVTKVLEKTTRAHNQLLRIVPYHGSDMAESWADYTRRVTEGATQSEIAAHTGIEQSSISRWRQGRNTPRAELVVTFARAYGRNPTEALIVAGYLDRDEIGGVIELETSISAVPTAQLLEELGRRFVDLQGRVQASEGGEASAQWPTNWTQRPPSRAGQRPPDHGDAGSAS